MQQGLFFYLWLQDKLFSLYLAQSLSCCTGMETNWMSFLWSWVR